MSSSYSVAASHDPIVTLRPMDDASTPTTKTGIAAPMLEEVKDDYHEKRRTWNNKKEYILTAVGYTVGLGNLWRFPYLCQQNGGGAFLIPYLLSLLVCGLPLYFLEAAVGQFSGRSSVKVWAVCPLLIGAGIGMNVYSVILFWYYNTIMAWALYYIVASFQAVVPWSRCDGWWNTPNCTVLDHASNRSSLGETDTSVRANVTNETAPEVLKWKRVSPAEEFWQHNVLQVSSGLGEPGHVVWYLALGLIVTLAFCFLSLVKGIRSTGKVVYVTAILPYVLLTAFIVRGVTLPGAADGIVFYLQPQFSRLTDAKVWAQAAVQVFYSLGPAMGGIITMASYNKFHNNCLRDSILVTGVCGGTSFYGGFAIFTVLGYMAHQSGVSIEKVVSSGPGLAFIAYPEAISLMPLPQLWAVLFFTMIIALAIDCQMTVAETVLTSFCDHFPRTLARHRVLFTALFCAFFIPIGLPFVTQGGIYMFQLVDWFMATITSLSIGFLECVALIWLYGVERFGGDINVMIGRRPPLFMKACWCVVTPAFLLLLLVFIVTTYAPPTYGDYHYGVWGIVFGWAVAFISFVPIPVMAVYQLCRARGTLLQRLKQTCKPDESWGPKDSSEQSKF